MCKNNLIPKLILINNEIISEENKTILGLLKESYEDCTLVLPWDEKLKKILIEKSLKNLIKSDFCRPKNALIITEENDTL